MDLSVLLQSKSIKPKDKTTQISEALLAKTIRAEQLVEIAATLKDPGKATCIEALEFATKTQPQLAGINVFEFVTQHLSSKAPRVKWESAKVIANTAHLFKTKLDNAINALLINTEHEGTVVRWSAATALSGILQLKTNHNNELVPTIEAIINREEKESIRKIYKQALKKLQ